MNAIAFELHFLQNVTITSGNGHIRDKLAFPMINVMLCTMLVTNALPQNYLVKLFPW